MQPKIGRQEKLHVPAIQGTGQTLQIPHLLIQSSYLSEVYI